MQALTCSLASLQAGEQLFGTAPQIKTWLLLEVNEPLTAQALVDNHLPEPVRAYVNALQKSIPASRVLLIQQGRNRSGSKVSFFICTHSNSNPLLLEYRLDDYSHLLDLDVQALVSGEHLQQAVRQQPLYLVCTNGKRDACCSSLGAPFYRRLAALEPQNTWQCSHVGGHRFAANAIYLPYGIYYGRLQAAHADEFLFACWEKQMLVDHYRGRAGYPAHVQAAEYYLHQQQPGLRLDALALEQVQETGPQSWQVNFRSPESAAVYGIQLAAGPSEYEVFENCGKSHELSRKTQYRLLA